MGYDVILDCYTDEPSGLGVPPYLGVHQRYIAGSLSLQGRHFYYLTIDDVRYAHGEVQDLLADSNVRIRNLTVNCERAAEILNNAERILVVSGAFVDYAYVSARPPTFDEIEKLISSLQSEKILFFALGIDSQQAKRKLPHLLFDKVVFGHSYNYLILNQTSSFDANYDLLSKISIRCAELLHQIPYPVIAEIETSSGCARKPGCSFCIENLRSLPLVSRNIESITAEITHLYSEGVTHFRLGRQPSFYSYMGSDPDAVENLLNSIRTLCPNLELLHIDNVNPEEVVSRAGRSITKHISEYCTSGNIAAFGVESFDPEVREINNLNGTVDQIHEAIEVINEYGSKRGSKGLPKYLPGINLIYNLPSQTKETFNFNIQNLSLILKNGNLTRRLFIRICTSAMGVTLNSQNGEHQEDQELTQWRKIIKDDFEIPMLKKIAPIGNILRDVRAEAWDNEGTLMRQLATCPVRIFIPEEKIRLDSFHDIVVKDYLDNRTVIGRIEIAK